MRQFLVLALLILSLNAAAEQTSYVFRCYDVYASHGSDPVLWVKDVFDDDEYTSSQINLGSTQSPKLEAERYQVNLPDQDMMVMIWKSGGMHLDGYFHGTFLNRMNFNATFTKNEFDKFYLRCEGDLSDR